MQLKQSNDSENNITGSLQTTAKCVCNRSPLTEEEIEYLAPVSFTWRDMVTFARNIEHEHGIGND